jgi:hypothetical protein
MKPALLMTSYWLTHIKASGGGGEGIDDGRGDDVSLSLVMAFVLLGLVA